MEDPTKREQGSCDDDNIHLVFCSEEDEEEEDDVLMSRSLVLTDHDYDNNTVEDLMEFVDDEATSSATKLKFIQNPYSSPMVFQSSTSYITINGNEETCGSSFSDWDSSVMVSVDTGGFSKSDCIDGFDQFCDWFQGGHGGAWVFNGLEEAAREVVCGVMTCSNVM